MATVAETWKALSVNLSAAKQAIGLPKFQHDALLTLSLLDTASLNETGLSLTAQATLKAEYRRLAYLGDYLIDAALADYLFSDYPRLTHEQMDTLRQRISDRKSLCQFAIQLGWPDYCTSRNRKNRRLPTEEAGTYGEMFEALVAAIYLEYDRDFLQVYDWLVKNFLQSRVERLMS
ncbi:MAG: ribonuclease III domain-containing protein [Phormidesmis sp.]